MARFNVNNPPKFYGIMVIITLAFVGFFIGRMDFTQLAATIGPFGGYLVGNGVAAKRGDPVGPAVSRRQDDEEG